MADGISTTTLLVVGIAVVATAALAYMFVSKISNTVTNPNKPTAYGPNSTTTSPVGNPVNQSKSNSDYLWNAFGQIVTLGGNALVSYINKPDPKGQTVISNEDSSKALLDAVA